MDKTQDLHDRIINAIIRAEEQRHINYEQKELLLDWITCIKNDIESEYYEG